MASFRKLLVSALTLIVVAAAGCTPAPSTPAPSEPVSVMAAKYGYDAPTLEQVIEQIDRDPRVRPLPLSVQVSYELVTFRDGTQSETLLLTGDRFYLAIEPYTTNKLQCHSHNPGTLQGELVFEPVQVTITDATGNVLVDETTITHSNGFATFWIPRDITGTVRIVAGSKSGTAHFASDHNAPTCLPLPVA